MTKHFHPPASARGLVGLRSDAEPTPETDLQKQFMKTLNDFRAANDKRIADVEKGLGDVVKTEEVDRINAELTRLGEEISAQALAAAARSTGPNDAGMPEAEAAQRFALVTGNGDLSVEDFRAYRQSLAAYMRRGNNSMPRDLQAAMSVGSDPAGGYTVAPDMSGRIVERIFESSPMRQVASVDEIGTDALEGFNDTNEAAAGWVGETATRSETSTPDIGKWSIPVHEVYAEPKTTQKLLDDSLWDVEAWLGRKIADKMARMENAAFVAGDGVLKPRGLFTYTTAATPDATRAWGSFEHVNTGQSAGFASSNPGDVLVNTVFALKAHFRTNGAWMMGRKTVAEVRKLKDGDGNYLWQPNFEARQGGNLLGYPIAEAEDVPVIAANSLSIAFGDFSAAYQIVDRAGIRLIRDAVTQKGFVKFYSTKRTGGGALDYEAAKFVRFGT